MSEQEEVSPAQERYEFIRAVIAMLHLAQLDLRAVDMFGRTPQAALRSVRFIFFCVPVVMLMAWPQAGEFTKITGYSPLVYSLLEASRILITSFGFLLFMHHLCRRLGVAQNFAHYMCVQCYVSLPTVMVVALLNGLWLAAGVSETGENLLRTLVYAAQIIIDWAITYGTLRIKPTAAFAICALAVLFSMLVQYFMLLVVILTGPIAI